MPSKLPFAEDLNYWQTGASAPDKWIDDAQAELRAIGGKIHGWAFGAETNAGRSAYMLDFELDGERYKIVWPVLPTRSGKNEAAARRQAATMLYHDIKNRCITAKVQGKRSAFFSYLLLPDGRTAATVATPDLADQLPDIFRPKLLTTEKDSA
ncbi:MAG: hypothetical protein AB7R40_22500 [Nitrospiraceae bacterium]